MLRDAELRPQLRALWKKIYSVRGRRKLAGAAKKAGLEVGRDRVARLMRVEGICRASRAEKAVHDPQRPELRTCCPATRPNEKWVAGSPTARRGLPKHRRRKASRSMSVALVFDEFEHGAWVPSGVDLAGVICHSDAGGDYVSIAHTDRLADIGAAPLTGPIGDSSDNAIAETVMRQFNTGLHRNPAALAANGGQWRGLDDLGIPTSGWMSWFNEERFHGTLRPHRSPGRRRLLPSQRSGPHGLTTQPIEPPGNPVRFSRLLGTTCGGATTSARVGARGGLPGM
jgi:putative transposase